MPIPTAGASRAGSATSARCSIPNIRTAKVRLEVANPGMMRLGMFVTATFHGPSKEVHAAVPATAVLHLHDRDWVYVPAGERALPPRGSDRGQDAARQHAGDHLRHPAGRAGGHRTRWCCRTRWSSNDSMIASGRFRAEQPLSGAGGGDSAAHLGRSFRFTICRSKPTRRRQQLRPGHHAVAGPRGRRSGAAGHHSDRNRDERHPAPGASAVHVAVRPLQRDADLRRRIRERLEPAEGAGAAVAGHPARESAAADRHRLEPGRPDLLVHAAAAPIRSTT